MEITVGLLWVGLTQNNAENSYCHLGTLEEAFNKLVQSTESRFLGSVTFLTSKVADRSAMHLLFMKTSQLVLLCVVLCEAQLTENPTLWNTFQSWNTETSNSDKLYSDLVLKERVTSFPNSQMKRRLTDDSSDERKFVGRYVRFRRGTFLDSSVSTVSVLEHRYSSVSSNAPTKLSPKKNLSKHLPAAESSQDLDKPKMYEVFFTKPMTTPAVTTNLR